MQNNKYWTRDTSGWWGVMFLDLRVYLTYVLTGDYLRHVLLVTFTSFEVAPHFV